METLITINQINNYNNQIVQISITKTIIIPTEVKVLEIILKISTRKMTMKINNLFNHMIMITMIMKTITKTMKMITKIIIIWKMMKMKIFKPEVLK